MCHGTHQSCVTRGYRGACTNPMCVCSCTRCVSRYTLSCVNTRVQRCRDDDIRTHLRSDIKTALLETWRHESMRAKVKVSRWGFQMHFLPGNKTFKIMGDPICSGSPCLKSFILLKTSTVYDCADLLQIRRGDRPRTRYKYLIQTNWPGFW